MTTEAEVPRQHGRIPPAFVALVAPDIGMERQARSGGVRTAFLVALVCSVLAGAAAAVRVDGRAATVQQLEMRGQIATMSDRQIDDEVKTAEKKFVVLSVAAKAVAPPVNLLLVALAIVALGWFLKGRIRHSAGIFPVSAAVLLPGAVANLVSAITIFRRPAISPDETNLVPRTLADVLAAVGHPLMGPMAKLASAFDFYTLWAALLMAFGIVAVTTVPPRRAVIGTLVAWACFMLLTTVAAASGGGPQMGGPHP